jgi:hypothetical protein
MTPDAADERSAPSIADFGSGMTEHGIAIAAVTEALWHLLQRELGAVLPGVRITARSPDKARDDGGGRQLNLFLYHDRRSQWNERWTARKSAALAELYYLVSHTGPTTTR